MRSPGIDVEEAFFWGDVHGVRTKSEWRECYLGKDVAGHGISSAPRKSPVIPADRERSDIV